MYGRGPQRMGVQFGSTGFGRPGRPPADLIALLAVLFVTYALQFFASTRIVPALLQLSPAVWRAGFLWQLATYAFSGYGPPSPWFLLELLVVYWFARDVRGLLGRGRFWRLLLLGATGAAAAAVAVQLAVGGVHPLPFQLMQGQRVLLALLLAAFAMLAGEATILLFFVLPVKAKLFVWLGPLLGFVAFLATKDLAGLVGICAATGLAAATTSPRGVRRAWLAWRGRRFQRRVDRLARKRNFRLVKPGDNDKPTIH